MPQIVYDPSCNCFYQDVVLYTDFGTIPERAYIKLGKEELIELFKNGKIG